MKTPGFTLLYIGGVAFTIAFTIIYGIILYGQLGPVYPEYDRNSTYYINQLVFKTDNMTMTTNLGQPFIDEFLRDSLKSVEKVTAIVTYYSDYPMVQTEGRGPEFHIEMRATEPSYFDFYKFDFLAGKPFSQEEFEAKDLVVAISDKVASKLFATVEEAVGQHISIDHVKYRITGVFREGSALCPDSYGEAFSPYYDRIINRGEWTDRYKGGLRAILKVKPGQEELLKKELREICQRINAVDTTISRFYIPKTVSHMEHVLGNGEYRAGDDEMEYLVTKSPNIFQLGRPFIIALLVILIIPALNISGLIGARMDRIRADLGIRRCFGATKANLLRMVMTENLILTLAGGILGLVAAWLIAAFAGSLLLQITPLDYSFNGSFSKSASFLTGEMAFAPVLFLTVLVLCLALNLLSAWIPAMSAMRRQITDSLNSKK